MTTKTIRNLEKKVEKKRAALAAVGPMRPGSLTRQYRNPEEKTGEYYQLSYTRLSRSRSEHVWPEHVRMMRDEIKAYQKHRKLHGELIELCIELSKAKISLLRKNSSR
jgi:hemerythrin